jgi:hypothetical protein
MAARIGPAQPGYNFTARPAGGADRRGGRAAKGDSKTGNTPGPPAAPPLPAGGGGDRRRRYCETAQPGGLTIVEMPWKRLLTSSILTQ